MRSFICAMAIWAAIIAAAYVLAVASPLIGPINAPAIGDMPWLLQ